MILALAAGHALAKAGLLLDALLAAVALCTTGRLRRAAFAGALAATPVLLVAELWHSTQITHLRHHPLLAVVGALAAVALAGGLALVVRDRPRLLALGAVAALPFRFSVLAGGTGGVLLPLYVVIAAGGLALVVWDRGRADEAPIGLLERALAGFVVLYGIQALYTPTASLGKAVEEVGFFLVPFALLFVLLRRLEWDRALVVRCAAVVVALAVAFVGVGAVEYASRHVLFNTALNNNERFFRVNSLFYDPNVFGRFLALTAVLVAAATVWESDRRRLLAAAGLLAVLWLGLAASVSQSSMVALLAGLVVVGAARFSVRSSVAAAAVLVAAGVVIAIAASGRLHLNLSDSSGANNATAGRYSLVREGIDLFGDRPLAGFGSASFSCEFLRDKGYSCAHSVPVTSDSHTIPITIAAEQGIIGLAAYALLLVAAFWRLAAGGLRRRAARVAVLAAFVALVVHTWAYADFLEDPITWTLLAVGTALARDD